MNATLKTAVVVTTTPNPNNEWRKAVTQAAIAAIVGGKAPDLTPFRTFPWNDRDDDRSDRSFGLGSLRHTAEYLRADARDLNAMRDRLAWLETCESKLQWMQTTLMRRVVNAFELAAMQAASYTGGDTARIHALAAAKAAAKASIVDAKTKTDGLAKAIAAVPGGVAAAIERLDKDGATLAAKRRLAGLLDPIIADREATLAAQKAAAKAVRDEVKAEVEAIMASTPVPAPAAPLPPKAKVTKAPAKSRGEVRVTSLEGLATALTEKAVRQVPERLVKKSEAMSLTGLDDAAFARAVARAEIAGEEEILTAPGKAVVLTRRVGNARRYFLKEVPVVA